MKENKGGISGNIRAVLLYTYSAGVSLLSLLTAHHYPRFTMHFGDNLGVIISGSAGIFKAIYHLVTGVILNTSLVENALLGHHSAFL